MRSTRRAAARTQRRAAVAVYLAISMTFVIGMAALAVDIGALYQAQAELQRVADAATLAAASRLVAERSADPNDPNAFITVDPETAAPIAANEVAELNAVLRVSSGLDADSDVELGEAVYDADTGRFAFAASAGPAYTAVRVTVRRTEGSEAGPIELMFAPLFGNESRGLEASAAAVLVPRDIAVVIDLSNSMNYDSQLRYSDRNDGGYANLRDVWCALDGWEPSRPYLPGYPTETEYASDTGPGFGFMTQWGDTLDPSNYDATNDDGLFYVPRYSDCRDSSVIANLQARGYSSDEIDILTSDNRDRSYDHWCCRAATCIGLATWKSGRRGGLYTGGGDGDSYVESGELVWVETPEWQGDWRWMDYVKWVGTTSLYRSNLSGFKYRYGMKTFTDYLLNEKPCAYQTTNLWSTPQQPLRSVKDAVQTMINTIDVDSLDHASLEIYATVARHQVDLTPELQAVPDRLYEMQSGHYDRSTCIGGGIARAISSLRGSNSRPNAAKVIVLMSDGKANVDENGHYSEGSQAASDYATDQAEEAANLGYRIYTISVGYSADQELMAEIAATGHGQHFHAEGSPEQYQEQLQAIFRALGGKRPVALIE